jgi:hypothetical protein
LSSPIPTDPASSGARLRFNKPLQMEAMVRGVCINPIVVGFIQDEKLCRKRMKPMLRGFEVEFFGKKDTNSRAVAYRYRYLERYTNPSEEGRTTKWD